jgi:NTE family protein
MKKIILLFIFAAFTFDIYSAVFEDNIFEMDLDIYYGEEEFKDRLAEIKDRKVLGLALSGGSARAFAHIGVLKRLEAEGIYPDYIVTKSMGSIVGLLYAAGFSPDQIYQIIVKVELTEYFDLIWPTKGGLLNSRALSAMLYSILGDYDMKDLKIPAAAIAEDLHSKRRVILFKGDFYKILPASFSLPAFFEPVLLDDFRLLDGGVTGATPLDIAAKYSDHLILSTAFYRKKPNLDNPFAVLGQSFDIIKTRDAVKEIKKYNPLMIKCDVEEFSFMDFHKIDEIVQGGWNSADKMAAELAAFKTEKPAWMDERRKELDKKIDAAFRDFRIEGKLFSKDPYLGAKVGIKMYDGYYNDYYLNDFNYLFAGNISENRFFSGFFNAFYRPEFMNDLNGYGLDAGFYLHFDKYLHFKSSMLVFFRTSGESLKPEPYSAPLYASIFARTPFLFDSVFKPFITAEAVLTPEAVIAENYYRAGLSISRKNGGHLNYNLTALVFNEDSQVYGAGGSAEAEIKITDFLFLNERINYKTALEDGMQIKYYKNDYFRGLAPYSAYDELIILNSDIKIKFIKFYPTFAEAFLLNNIFVSIFFDAMLNDERYSAGLHLNSDLSLMGLKPISFYAFAGRDFKENKNFLKVIMQSKL